VNALGSIGAVCARRTAAAPASRSRAIGALAFAALALGGCEKTFRNMYDQPKLKPLAASALWPDGRGSRPPVAATVARSEGAIAGTSSGRLGSTVAEPDVARPLPTIVAPAPADADIAKRATWTLPFIERGRERYDIYCAPCHSPLGDGDGRIAQRGFPHPPSYHSDRLRNASDEHFYAVMTHGYGAMYSYADRVSPDDRRAIIAYIRALQLAQHAQVADVPADVRAALEKAR